ncbi:rhomboid family intramembrane serine protease [Polymorphobacter multimanifer]|nr:rhomboid family intramembrane serine protease [Polymorphobacter multimanifer]
MKPFKPPSPMATNGLILLCVAVQGALLIGGSGFDSAIIARYGLVPARISAVLAGVEPAGSLGIGVTHMFLHSGLLHLGLNMLFLAWVGRYVEWVTGRIGLIGLFLAGGLVGGAAQWFADPASMSPVIGASGAIAAVFGAYAMMFARSRAGGRRVLGIAVPGELLTALWYAASWIGLQLLMGVAFSGGLLGGGIAIWTHIGGFLTGLILARFWGRGPEILP